MKRRFLAKAAISAAAATLAWTALPASAQSYPSKPIHIIVPYSAGGGTDLVARALGTHLSKRMNESVIVENKPGGNGLIATQYVTRAKPDGYTLYLTVTSPWSMLPALYSRPLGYDANKDYTPIALLCEVQSVIFVNPKTQITSMKGLVDYARANPGKLSYSSAGAGQPYTLATELLKTKLGIDILQVPFAGGAPMIQAVVAGDVNSSMADVGSSSPFIKDKRLTALAVMGKQRVPSLPDVPTLEEAGFSGVNISMIWFGIVGPGGMDPQIVKRLNEEINEVLRSPEMRTTLTNYSLTPIIAAPQQLEQQIKSDIVTWGAVIKQIGIKLD